MSSDRRERDQRISRDVDDEVRFHLERKVARLVASGMSEEEARREAERRFGDVALIKERMTRMSRKREDRRRWSDAWDQLRQDLAYALRRLARSPGFAAVTALTLTLGIGATTAVFSVVDGILFRPLPYAEPDELVAVWSDWSRRGGPADEWPNFPNLWGLREQSRQLEAVGIVIGGGRTLTGIDGPAEALTGASLSYDMFARVLLVEAELGRVFGPEDDRPDAPGTVILSHALWTRAFGADPGLIGRSITLNGLPNEVIGVMPRGFQPPPILQGDIWTPLRMDMASHSCGVGGACMLAIARLADGATVERARAEAAQIAARQEAAAPEGNAGVGWALEPLRDDLVAQTRVELLVLLGTAGFVLLMACVNQAGLLLARGTGRRAELAIRSAIGANRRRIVSQLMVESVVLALLGGVLGIGAAYLLTDVLVRLAPPGTPRIDEVAVDGRVLMFAAAITVLSGLLFGSLPALRSARGAIQGALQEVGRGGARAAGLRLRQGLVVTQVALALVLLTGSGLLIRTLQNLRGVDLGFRPEGILTFRINLPPVRYAAGEPILAFQRALEERLAALPGVQSVALTSSLPLAGFNQDSGFNIEGRPVPAADQSQAAWIQNVTAAYLETMGTAVLRGRGILTTDTNQSTRVLVINEAFAARHFGGADPLGQRINFGDPANPVWWEIVGVARDSKHFGIREAARVSVYRPFDQVAPRGMTFVLRSEGDPEVLVAGARRVITEMDDQLAAGLIAPMDDYVKGNLAPERFVTMLVGLFAGVALALAIVGLYGVVSYNVNARLREMGLRLVLGASASGVARMVVTRSLTLVGIGLALGLAASAGLTRFLRSMLFGVSAADVSSFVVATALLGGVALLASLLPARRAASVDPSEVLRED